MHFVGRLGYYDHHLVVIFLLLFLSYFIKSIVFVSADIL